MIIGWKGNKTVNAQGTVQLGEDMSRYIEKGEVLALVGELASGKTTFIKGILRGMKYLGAVTSPTFTLINEYHADLKVIHIDFYRENDTKRWEEIGINEYLYSDNLVIIEWGNMINDILPNNVIPIYFKHIELNKRKIYSNYEPFGN